MPLIKKGILKYSSAMAIIFYYFFHVTYMRRGKSTEYSLTWTPNAAIFPFIGFFALLIKPFDKTYFFLLGEASQSAILPPPRNPFIIFFALLFFSLTSIMRSRHNKIITMMKDVRVPNVYFLIFLGLIFSLPITLFIVSMGRLHYFFTLSMVIAYYSLFYFLYASKKVNFN